MNVSDMVVRFSEALPSLPVLDALRMAANLRDAGLILCSADTSGGWCSECRVLFASSDATMCRFCGYALDPVSFALEDVARQGTERGDEDMSDPVTTDIEVDDEVSPDEDDDEK